MMRDAGRESATVAVRLNERIASFESSFRRLDALLADAAPNPALAPILMHVGEPQDAPPPMLAEAVAAHAHEWNRYPPSLGTPEFRRAALGYLERRYPAVRGRIDAEREISAVASTREALFLAASIAVSPARETPLALMPNPFYQTYRAGALMAGAVPRYFRQSGFPQFALDLDSVSRTDLARTAVAYLCSPSNPEGRAMEDAQLRRAIELAREHGFLLVFDECYAELYDREPPPGALDALATMPADGHWLDNVLILHSLSKRSSAAGLRSGFVVGAPNVIGTLNKVRLSGTACSPLPLLAAATALWSDDAHVDEMRARLRMRLDIADRHLGGFPGYYRPPCGFFVWLQVDDGVALTRRLWTEHALKVLPGEFLTQPDEHGANDGKRFIRIALVQDFATVETGLARLARVVRNPG